MKVKTSVTLSEDLVRAVDKLSGPSQNRSEFVESALRSFIEGLSTAKRNARDLEIINRRAEALNAEAEDALTYQVPL